MCTHSEKNHWVKVEISHQTCCGGKSIMKWFSGRLGLKKHTVSEETAHPTVYHHLGQLSFDIQ